MYLLLIDMVYALEFCQSIVKFQVSMGIQYLYTSVSTLNNIFPSHKESADIENQHLDIDLLHEKRRSV